MANSFLVLLVMFFSLFFQSDDLQRQVSRKHPNGKPYVVLYFKKSTQELMKEEVFYSNGNLQWSGTYKNSKEEGTWKYYYENGRLKSEQHFSKGKEEGTFSDFDESGKLVKQSHYKNGKLIRELTF